MEGWTETSRVSVPNTINSLEFDRRSKLLWSGDTDGYLNSFTVLDNGYSGPNSSPVSLYPYTKFRASINEPINQIIDSGTQIYLLSHNNIHVNNKRGLPITNINSTIDKAYEGFNCMTLNDINNDLIVSKQDSLVKINLNSPQKHQALNYSHNLSFINHQSKFLTLGRTNGSIDLFDHNSNQVIKEFTGHNNGISDLDVKGNYLVTSGYSIRHNTFFIDPLINLYDLRMMKLLLPIPFPFGPSFVKFHPKLPNMILIGSKNGHLQFLDIFDQSNFNLYQTDLMNNSNVVSNMKFSNNGENIAISDSFNNLMLWSFNNSKDFNNFPVDLENVSTTHEHSRNLPVDDPSIPLNAVGMPYYKDLLLSNYRPNLIFTKESAKLPMSYDPNLPNLQLMENKSDTNFNKYYPLNKSDQDLPFISDNNLTFRFKELSFFKIPNCYHKLLIKYSRFGIEDFNFDVFNNTTFSGLENNLDNSYLNSILQIYKYQSNFQNLVLRNLFKEWLPNDSETVLTAKNFKGSSILNELGYLYDMLNKSNGKNFKISNFSEFLNSMAPPELLNFDDLKSVDSSTLKQKILSFNQFFLNKLLDDFHIQNSFLAEFSKLCLIKFVNEQSQQLNLINLINIYPVNIPNTNLIDYLNFSLTNILELPQVLSINVNFNNKNFKSLPDEWLPEYIYAEKSINNTIVFINDGSNNNNQTSLSFKPFKSFRLLGYVAEVNNGPETSIGNHNLVSFVRIDDKWYLFNDFLVMEIDKSEVINFKRNSKKPLILLYEDVNEVEPLFRINADVYPQIDDSILYKDHFALTIRENYAKQYQLLTKQLPPQPGSLIAIDAEFVMLLKELVEINSTGGRKLIRPKKSSLARISVIDLEETPFIDDYIIHTQPIEDYITSFSGIEPGDLDPINSDKSLVTFQTSYRRLWLLLNLGCVFVGHGLQNDFRTINLHVPKHQIKDTIDLFFLPDFKRKLSLKFLSYVLLNEKVQTGNHDSIEDARFALKLYKRYLKLKEENQLEITLDHIYLEGQRMKFRVPEAQ